MVAGDKNVRHSDQINLKIDLREEAAGGEFYG
jgi:hypothetical protein